MLFTELFTVSELHSPCHPLSSAPGAWVIMNLSHTHYMSISYSWYRAESEWKALFASVIITEVRSFSYGIYFSDDCWQCASPEKTSPNRLTMSIKIERWSLARLVVERMMNTMVQYCLIEYTYLWCRPHFVSEWYRLTEYYILSLIHKKSIS